MKVDTHTHKVIYTCIICNILRKTGGLYKRGTVLDINDHRRFTKAEQWELKIQVL